MRKKSDNHQEKRQKEFSIQEKKVPIQQKNQVPMFDEKQKQQYRSEKIFELMSPFPLPPKYYQPHTAMTQGYYSGNTDLRQISTPYNNNQSIFRVGDIEYMQEDLRAISSKIDWQKSPAKSEQQNSQYQQYSQSYQKSDLIPQQSQPKSYEDSIQEVQIQKSQVQKPSIFEKKRLNKRSAQIKQVPEPNKQNKKVTCNCKKTKCLKLYCDCFRINQTCQGCNCVGCHNLEEYAEQRNNAILVLMDRNPDPFSQKIQDDKHAKGCNCKKSNCLKKYCQCYQAGLKCGQNCKCDQCKNGGHQREKQHHFQQDKSLINQQKPEKNS